MRGAACAAGEDLRWMGEMWVGVRVPRLCPVTAWLGSFGLPCTPGNIGEDVSWLPAAEDNKCVTDRCDMTAGTLRCHGLMSGWSALG